MTELAYRLTSRQRLLYYIAGAVMFLTVGLQLTTGAPPIFWGAVGLLWGGVLVLMSTCGATIDGTGVHLRGLTRQTVPWEQIQDVEVSPVLGSQQVRLRLAGGGTKRLRAPITGPLQRDPEFDGKVATIRHWWQHYSGHRVA